MSTTRETVLRVEGMTCHSCVRHVDQALRDVEGVSEVRVALATGQVIVGHDQEAHLPDLVQALEAAGYPARPAT